jgi:hypothetical protein
MNEKRIALMGRVHGLLAGDNTPAMERERIAAAGVMSDTERHVRANASKLFAPKQPRGAHLCKCGRPISANKTSCKDCQE